MDIFDQIAADAKQQQIDKGDGWERIIDGTDEITERLRVPGGWIYRSWVSANNDSLAMVFVPKPREESKDHAEWIGDRLDGIGNQLQRIANELERR